MPSFNVINGGSHAGNRLACQETVDDVDNDRFRLAGNLAAGVHDSASGRQVLQRSAVHWVRGWRNLVRSVLLRFPTRWDRTRPGLPFVEELHQEEVRTGLVADVDFDTHVPPVSCWETKDACNVGDEAREVSQSENGVRSGVQIHQNKCSGVYAYEIFKALSLCTLW